MGNLLKVALCAAVFFISSAASAAHISVFEALLNGDQSGSGADGLGSASITFNSDTSELAWFIAWEGLTGAPTAGHFHGPAGPGMNAGVEVGFDHTSNPSIGTAFLSAQQSADLFAELWYINIHTVAFPGGEIRGQVLNIETVNASVVPLPAAAFLLAPALGGLMFSRRRG